MGTRLDLAYGSRPMTIEVPAGATVILAPTPDRPAPALGAVLAAALDAPVDSARLEARARPGDRVLVIVSDPSRDDPRAALVAAVRARLPAGIRLTVAVATGTHGPCDPAALGLDEALADADLVNHDGAARADLVTVGTSRRGTPFAVHRAVVESDLVIATGTVRPHYFAGFGAGIKAVFPGLGGAVEIRINHRLKAEPGARAGVVDGNPCRDDLEEILEHLARPPFLVDTVVDGQGVTRGAAAGEARAAFRAAVRISRPLFTVRARRHRTVVVSDGHPVSASLYQAAKLVAAAAPLVADGGTIVVAADCAEGIGPLEVVNRAIFELGVLPRLPPGVRIVLVSDLPDDAVRRTPCLPAGSVAEALGDARDVAIVPRGAATLIVETA